MAAGLPAAAGERLDAGLAELGLGLPEATRTALLQYVALLAKWNRAYNLTAVRDPVQMVTRHLLDALAVLPHLPPGRLLDVGSGAGVPGIPLALARPALAVVLLDGSAKRCRFLRQAVAALGLADATVVHSRVEDYRPESPFDVIIARAYAALTVLLEQTEPLLAPGGEVLAMKGLFPEEELADLPGGFRVAEVVPLTVPGLEAARHLVRVVRSDAATGH